MVALNSCSNHVFHLFLYWPWSSNCQSCRLYLVFTLILFTTFHFHFSERKKQYYLLTDFNCSTTENGYFKGSLTGVSIGTVTKAQKVWGTFQALGNIAFAYSYSQILIEIQVYLFSLCSKLVYHVLGFFQYPLKPKHY